MGSREMASGKGTWKGPLGDGVQRPPGMPALACASWRKSEALAQACSALASEVGHSLMPTCWGMNADDVDFSLLMGNVSPPGPAYFW